MSNNPYETNYSNLTSSNVTDHHDSQWNADLEVKEALTSLARWQTFFAIVGVILSGMMFLLLIAQLASGLLNARGAIGMGAPAFMLVVMVLFYVLPIIRLFQATSAIRKFGYDGSSLRNVIEAQRSFWRTIGVLAIVAIGLYMTLLFLMILGAGSVWI